MRPVSAQVQYRSSLAERLANDCTPATWKDLFAVVGVSDADALLVQIGRSVLSALEALPLSVENAQSRLLVMRGHLHAAVDRRCDELEAGIRNAEITKRSKLERALVDVDTALDVERGERAALSSAVASLSDDDILIQSDTLNARLDALQMRPLPTLLPLESPTVGLDADLSTTLSQIASFGTVTAPKPVTAQDLTTDVVAYARPSETFHLRLIAARLTLVPVFA